MVANKLTGEKGILLKAEYVTEFEEMEQGILQDKRLEMECMKIRASDKRADARLRQAKYLEKHTKLSPQSALVAAGSGSQPLPEVKYYSATDIAKEAGVSANKVGRVANDYKIKTDAYGMFVLDKSRHSSEQVEFFNYNVADKQRLLSLLSS